MFKVLIVDDELLMRVGLTSLIDWEHYNFCIVGEASNGREALELVHQHRPDLIITDIKMPIMDGLDLMRETSKVLKACKYVVLSNFDEFRFVKEALRLGAMDYIIKSDIKSDTLTDLLERVKQKLMEEGAEARHRFHSSIDFTQSLSFLKESLFKDLISGLQGGEELAAKATQLQVRIKPEEIVVLKFAIDHFVDVKQKYVEADEKLLRFSVVNILNEILPAKWEHELVVESSAEYLWFANPRQKPGESLRAAIESICRRAASSLKDFMNIQVSIGVSTPVEGYSFLRVAYQEADLAVQSRFFAGLGRVLFYEDIMHEPSRDGKLTLDREDDRQFLSVLETKDEARLHDFLNQLDERLRSVCASESVIRRVYIYLMEMVRAYFAHLPLFRNVDNRSSYESVMTLDTWEEIRLFVVDCIHNCFRHDSSSSDPRTYSELAVELILNYYHEDISLQSAAAKINVNPSYLSRIFKQETGENFINYLTRVRIDKAKSLLANKALRVYEVAEQVGYHNYTYFSKIFKKVTGMSPEDYRAALKAKNE